MALVMVQTHDNQTCPKDHYQASDIACTRVQIITQAVVEVVTCTILIIMILLHINRHTILREIEKKIKFIVAAKL